MHDLLHEGQLAAIHGGNLLVHGGACPVAAQWRRSFQTDRSLTSTPNSDLIPHIHAYADARARRRSSSTCPCSGSSDFGNGTPSTALSQLSRHPSSHSTTGPDPLPNAPALHGDC